eukprot:UC4_evm1s1349
MLGRMFHVIESPESPDSDKHCCENITSHSLAKADENGAYHLCPAGSPGSGITGSIFRAILGYHKTGIVHCPSDTSISEVRRACDYFLIPFDHTTIRSDNVAGLLHELSNTGATNQFDAYIDNLLLPAMGNAARGGDREAHIVILEDGDKIEWDEQHPPGLGEEYAQIVRSSALCRFFRSWENRKVAKSLLRDKGLTQVQVGIEGFPTHAENFRVRSNGQRDVVYSYEQRPFI